MAVYNEKTNHRKLLSKINAEHNTETLAEYPGIGWFEGKIFGIDQYLDTPHIIRFERNLPGMAYWQFNTGPGQKAIIVLHPEIRKPFGVDFISELPFSKPIIGTIDQERIISACLEVRMDPLLSKHEFDAQRDLYGGKINKDIFPVAAAWISIGCMAIIAVRQVI